MNIARIAAREIRLADGSVFVEGVITIGQAQGFLGLPIRIGVDAATGYGTMTSAWEPSPKELAALNAGAKVHVQLLGHRSHPPMMVEVGEPPSDEEPPPEGKINVDA